MDTSNGEWSNGADSLSYREGDSVPFRILFSGLTAGTTYGIVINYDTTKGGKPLGTIRAVDPEWDFLHNADGSTTAMGRILGWNLAAPSDKGVPAQVAKVFAYAAKTDGLYCTVRIGKPGAAAICPTGAPAGLLALQRAGQIRRNSLLRPVPVLGAVLIALHKRAQF